ncbi:MAG: hypothetical protein ACHQRJ_03780 [Alphaproteobacteria bacterium]
MNDGTIAVRTIGGAAMLLAVLAAAPALAEMPRYDVAAHCKAIAEVGGAPSEAIRQGCYQQEQAAYDALKPRWDQLEAAMRQHCDQIARAGGRGSYAILEGCIQQEIEAGKANKGFEFKY